MLPDIKLLKTIICDTAQEEIMPRFRNIEYQLKDDGSLVTDADLASDKRICEALAKAYPEIAFLSEEMSLAEQENLLKTSSQLWCLDPLDGTSNFAAGIPLFATSLALIVEGEVQIGISYDAIRDEMFSAVKDQGAYLNDKAFNCAASLYSLNDALAIIDFKRINSELAMRLIKNSPYRSQRTIGSSVLEWVWMASNRGQVYLHGGMKLWDLAAGSLILAEAGGYSCDLNGDDVFKATMATRSAIISPDKDLFEEWRDHVFAMNKEILEATDAL